MPRKAVLMVLPVRLNQTIWPLVISDPSQAPLVPNTTSPKTGAALRATGDVSSDWRTIGAGGDSGGTALAVNPASKKVRPTRRGIRLRARFAGAMGSPFSRDLPVPVDEGLGPADYIRRRCGRRQAEAGGDDPSGAPA